MVYCNSIWASRHSNSSSLYQAALIVISGDDLITWVDSFNSTIIKEAILSYNYLFSLEPICSPPKFSSHFYKYISSNKRQSSNILPSSFKACAYLIALIFPLLILLNKGRENLPITFYMTELMYIQVMRTM